MQNSEEAALVSEEEFLESDVKNYRYEDSYRPNSYRLYHCEPDGSKRFSLYFGAYCREGDNSPYLDVTLSNIGLPIQEIRIGAELENKSIHYVLEKTAPELYQIAKKICEVLNFHHIATAPNNPLRRTWRLG